ncbi:MAG: Gfo/Idh/MocA family oxidoreductase [Bacteroidales bacterium]
MDRKIVVGLASYGLSGQVFHAPLLHAHAGFQLKAIVERHKQLSVDRYPYVKIADDFMKLLDDPDIELVVINTPDHLHYTMALEALRAGKHVIVEKPFVLHSADGNHLIEEASRRNLMLSVYHNRRWDNGFLTIRKIIEENLLGRIVEYEAHFDRYRNFIQDSWKEDPSHGTESIFNLGSHLIDQALVLFGIPDGVFADIRCQREGAKVNDAFDLRFFYQDKRVLLKSSYLVKEPGPAYCLNGTEGSYVKFGIDPQEELLKSGRSPDEPGFGIENPKNWGIINFNNNGRSMRSPYETVPGNYLSFYSNIYGHLCYGTPQEVTATMANQVICLIEACLKSMKERRIVQPSCK